MQLGSVILCGGKSSRMGLPKATLPFGRELMLQRVVRLVSEVAVPIVVVRAKGQELPPLPEHVIVTEDARSDRGPLEGLHAGLSAMRGKAEAVYATSCDVPLLAPALVKKLADLFVGHQAAVPVDGKFHHPLSAIYAVSVAATIKELLESDRMRPVFLFDRVDTRRVPVDELRGVDPELRSLMNLNRPEDYRHALRLAGFNDQAASVSFPEET